MSNSAHIKNIAVIGAGIIGVNTAYKLQKNKYKVTLFDEFNPGSQTSYGNAGTFANYGIIPINTTDIYRNLPYLIFSNKSPLSIQFRSILFIMPWVLKFLKYCSEEKINNIIKTLSYLLKKSEISNKKIFEDVHLKELINNNETLYLYENEYDFLLDKKNIDKRKDYGINFKYIGTSEINHLEPNLKKKYFKGLLFEKSQFTINPLKYILKIFNNFKKLNGIFIKKKIDNIICEKNKINLFCKEKKYIYDKVIICTGAYTKHLATAVGDNFPLISERGYHLMFPDQKNQIKRPIAISNQGIYFTPMEEGLRVAGTVEIGLNNKKINNSRVNWIKKNTFETFNFTEDPESIWLGHRPTLPDSLPVIGCSKKNKNILYNFGHQHLGLTLGAISADIIVDILQKNSLNNTLDSIKPTRFS